MKIFKRNHYEKLLAQREVDFAKSVKQHQLDIQESQRKIEELQSKCSHDTYEVVFYSWRPGAMHPSHVCTLCDQYLGSATEEESKKLWDSYHAPTGQSGVQTTVDLTPEIKERK